MPASLTAELTGCVEEKRDRLLAIVRDLVRTPSENTPPAGAEAACQQYVAHFLKACAWPVEAYELHSVPELCRHPLFRPGRHYDGRPNVVARKAGSGGGRSLILSGHIDTVPRGSQNWSRDPFGGAIEGGRLFGRGSNDMKAGIATNLFVAEMLRELGLRLRGDLIIESVVDEEYGGANGTLAGRVKGIRADAAVISEPSLLRVCAAQRGGRTVHVTLRAAGGILNEGRLSGGTVEQLRCLLEAVPAFAEQRRRSALVHPLYAGCEDPVPVAVTRIFTAPWGLAEPLTISEECRVEIYWQSMPGEEQSAVEGQFFAWLRGVIDSHPELFRVRPELRFPIEWLPGSAISADEPVVRELRGCAEEVLGRDVPVTGIEGPCDLFMFHAFGIPAVIWGVTGGNTHAADEYVEIESLVSAAKALLLFVCKWCEVD